MATENTKYGNGALNANNNTSPGQNSAFGVAPLSNNIGKWNTAVGAFAGLANTNGISNTCVGTNALLQNITGSYNTALGTATLCYNVDGISNTAIGSNAMAHLNNTTGSENTALGTQAGFLNSGNQNTFLGAHTDASASYTHSTAIGYGSQIDDNNQIKMGTNLETVQVPGILNTTQDASIHGVTVGMGSGNLSSNTAVGTNALVVNTSGFNNTAVGYRSLYSNTIGFNNTALGNGALFGNTGNAYNNTALGHHSLYSNKTGYSNTAIGYYASYNNITGHNNTALGTTALEGNTGGSQNTALGYQAGYTINGSYNTALGYQAGFNNVTDPTDAAFKILSGINNTLVGRSAGANLTTGSNNTCVGYNAGLNLTDQTNVTCIGNGATGASNEVVLGNSSITALRCQVALTIVSDARDKKDIVELTAGLDFVEKLKPVSFTWNMRDGGKVDIPDTGFIAQDLQQVQIDTGITIPYLVYDMNPEKLEASYGKLLPVLVKAIQDLKKEVDELKAQINV
jgi:hypothetical protein